MSWIQRNLQRAITNTRRTMNGVASNEEILYLTLLAFVISMIQTVNVFLNIYNWINTNPTFDAYHPLVPMISLIGWILYIYVLSMKQVYKTSLLPFVPGALGIFYSFLLFLFKYGLLSPSFFKFW
jgi:hypothetical protein